MKYKVIFDTNPIFSQKSLYDFFGSRPELQKFLEIAEIIIPEMVIEEIKNQKRDYLETEKKSFLRNPFYSLKSIGEKMHKDFDIKSHILEIYESAIPHEVISLTSETALEDMKRLCLKKLPPFGKEDDRGFKDAYIYFTILDYLKKVGDEIVYFVTSDTKFKEAFKEDWKIVVVENYNEFTQYSGAFFDDDYFINQLGDYLGCPTELLDIKQRWINPEGNWILEVGFEDKFFLMEVDFSSKEIIDSAGDELSENINSLINSFSFQQTHMSIYEIKDHIKFFTYEEIFNLIEAAVNNSQICSIAGDGDVEEFFIGLYKRNRIQLNEELDKEFKACFDVPL